MTLCRRRIRLTRYRYGVRTARQWALVAAFSLGSCLPAQAGDVLSYIGDFRQAAEHGKTFHQFNIDNDSLLLTRRDGFYSSGLRYTQLHEMREDRRTHRYGWRLGQELYTASDIKLPPELIHPNDHPYAGWLYAGIFKQIVQPNGASWKWGVDVGCLGPCAGGEGTQTTLHRILNQPLPQGWAKQLRNEWGAVLQVEKNFAPWRWRNTASLTPGLHGRIGNIFTDARAVMVLRMGRLQETADSPAMYGFFRMDGRLVGYNATLQGGHFSRNNPHTVDPEPWVGEAEAGVVWRHPPFGLRVSVMRRSNEIRGLTNTQGSQNIGTLQFSYFP